MSRGIYILANDKVYDNAVALLNSIRVYDPGVPVIMVPYDKDYKKTAATLNKSFKVELFENMRFVKQLSEYLHKDFINRFSPRPPAKFRHGLNLLFKFVCWFGPFEDFLYLDTDMVVFEKISQAIDYLTDYDFVCCDYQYLNGLKHVFTKKIIENNIFTGSQINNIFNSGFWASKNGVISEDALYKTLDECTLHSDYFELENGEQPIANYLVLKHIKKIFNICRDEPKQNAGSWAGSAHFKYLDDHRLTDTNVNQPLKYLHWAGIKIRPGCPYRDIWEYYRFLNEPKEIPKKYV